MLLCSVPGFVYSELVYFCHSELRSESQSKQRKLNTIVRNDRRRVPQDFIRLLRANTVRPYDLRITVVLVRNPTVLGRFVNRPYGLVRYR